MADRDDKRIARLLGTFFHDIGKFHYRAESISADHATKSGYFLREYLQRFRSIPKAVLEEAIRIAEQHHYNPESPVREADHIAAEERVADESTQALRPLFSVFQNIQIGKGSIPKGTFYYKPDPISIENVFPEFVDVSPSDWKPDKNEVRSWHKESWEKFRSEVNSIPAYLPFDQLFNTLYYLMSKYTARVTSAGYRSVPDISLFDHSRVVAAYADCLESAEDEEYPFLVIEGDISGIQNYIYNVVNPSESDQSGTSKLLRGRSLYINLLSDSIAYFILQELHLYQVHLLMNGGGNFHIIAPNTQSNQERLERIQESLDRWFLEEFGGELGVILVYNTFTKADIRKYSYVKQQMIDLLTTRKNKKYFSVLSEHYLTFGPHEPPVKGRLDVCRICGSDYNPEKSKRNYCDSCANMMAVGKQIPYTKYLIQVQNMAHKVNVGDIPYFYLKGIRQAWYFVRDMNELEQILAKLPEDSTKTIYSINETSFLEESASLYESRFSGAPIQFGYKFIGQYAPVSRYGNVKSFEEIAKEGPSYPYIHVLRMDVDSLGKIFIEGLSKSSYSMGRITNLSRELDLFFTGYINRIAEEYHIYVTYSGGDDLFVVGHWEEVAKFALKVRNEFRRMVCSNPNLTISGGAFLMRPNFPIRRAAELCGKLEEEAKETLGPAKNCISIFGEVLTWKRYDEILSWCSDVLRIIKKSNENRKYRSIIRYAKSLHDTYFMDEGGESVEWIHKIRHKLYYILARRAKITHEILQKKQEWAKMDDERQFIETFSQLLKPETMEHIVSAATYIILSSREYS